MRTHWFFPFLLTCFFGCEQPAAHVPLHKEEMIDHDGDGWCEDGHDLNADGDCEDSGESLARIAGDCNDLTRGMSPRAREICGNGIDDDCGESPCATPGSCPDPDSVDPDCTGR